MTINKQSNLQSTMDKGEGYVCLTIFVTDFL